MFQKGTGERFKYKAAVLAKIPNAHSEGRKFLYDIKISYAIFDNEKRISEVFNRAEDAWADAYFKNVITNSIIKN